MTSRRSKRSSSSSPICSFNTGSRMRSLGVVVLACIVVPSLVHAQTPPRTPEYVGSAECRVCHTAVYDRWKNTRMANVVRDPKEHPEAIIPDLSKPDPLLTFTKDQIAWVYGSKWKQRYFTRIGDDTYPLGAQWDVTHKQWRPYQVANGTDWWTKFYPG